MRQKTVSFLCGVLVLGMAGLARADDPTSRFLPLAPLGSSLAASSTGLTVQFEVWDQASDGTMIFSEVHTVDTDEGSNITNDTGSADLLLGRPAGLDPTNFPAGSTSRYLDVTQDGVSVLGARVPLYASAFSISPGTPGPAGPKGDKGDKGDPGPQGTPGVVQTVTAVDTSISVTGTPQDRSVAVAANGITNAHISNGALSPAKITGVAATLGPNNFVGDQSTNGNLGASGNLTMVDSSATAGNILKGGVPFIQNFGFNNTFIGKGAGNLTTTGMGLNTAIGAGALGSITFGFENTATGFDALQTNTSGAANTADGVGALQTNTSGEQNTASGWHALRRNDAGSYNTASGYAALILNTSGEGNTAIGWEALFSNTTGTGNTAIGYGADVFGALINATAIGANARVDASNKIRLGDAFVTLVETNGNIRAKGQFAVTSQAPTADMVQRGKAPKNVGGCITITFPVAFSAPPNVVVSSHWDGVGGDIGAVEVIKTISATGFVECSVNNAATYFVQWIAIGPR